MDDADVRYREGLAFEGSLSFLVDADGICFVGCPSLGSRRLGQSWSGAWPSSDGKSATGDVDGVSCSGYGPSWRLAGSGI